MLNQFSRTQLLLGEEAMNKLKEIDTMKITASFVIRLYRKA